MSDSQDAEGAAVAETETGDPDELQGSVESRKDEEPGMTQEEPAIVDAGEEVDVTDEPYSGQDAEREEVQENPDETADLEEEVVQKRKKKKKNGGGQFLELEAEVSSDEEVSEDEDVGSDGDVEGLIDDSEKPELKRRKRKRGTRKKKHEDLVQDDYELVSDALGRKIERDVDEDVEDGDEEEQHKRLRLKKPKARVVVEDVVPLEPVSQSTAESDDQQGEDGVGEDEPGMYDDPSVQKEQALEEEWEKRQRLEIIFEGFEDFMSKMRGEEEENEEDQKEEDEDEEESDDEVGDKPRVKTQAQIEQEIWKFDCPERLQSRQSKRMELSPEEQEDDIKAEAQWIYNQAFSGKVQWRCPPELDSRPKIRHAKPTAAVNTINAVLTFIRSSRYEIPVIAEYKRDYLSLPASGLSEKHLYVIDEWDDKWVNMARRRARLLKMNSKILFCQQCPCVLPAESFQEDQKTCFACSHETSCHVRDARIDALTKSAADQVELDDIQDFLKFTQLMEAITLEDDDDKPKVKKGVKHKRVVPNGLQAVNRFSKVTGLKTLVAKLGISARQFGENLVASHSRHKPPPMAEDLQELAADLIGPKLPTVESVLRAVRRVSAAQIVHDPLVRQAIRKKWAESAVVSTFPTTKGVREINWAHPYFEVKRVENKPVPLFRGSLFVKLVQAAKEGFITYNISIPQSSNRDWLLEELTDLYCDFGLSPVDAYRADTLKDAVGILYSMAKSSCEAKLMADASNAIIKEARKNFERNHLLVKKYEGDTKDHQAGKFNIVSCVIGEENEPTVFVLLNKYGDVVDHLALHFIKTKLDPRIEDATAQAGYKKKRQEIKYFEEFIKSHDPILLLLDASSLKAKDFKQELRSQALFKNAIEFVDPVLGKVFAKSERADREFREFSPLLRQAISMGRLVLDPISELAGFWYQDEDAHRNDNQGAREILHLNLHQLQNMVPPTALLQALEYSFVKIINYVGLDINKVVNRPHLQSTAQFICGLGPVKAKRLLANAVATGYQGNRKSLAPMQDASGEIVDDAQLGQMVYENCAGFIMILGNSATTASDVRITPLDAMRIHPDWYTQAQRIAIDAMEAEIDENEDEDTQQENIIQVIEQVMEPRNHKRVTNLDLDAFADSLENEDHAGKWHEALQQMAAELCGTLGFSDHKKKFPKEWKPPLEGDALFEALTGETSSTLREHQLITVTVVSLKAQGAICRLPSGLRGEIRLSELSDRGGGEGGPNDAGRDKRDLEYVESILTKLQTIQARVVRIEKERWNVQLSCKSSVVRSQVDEDYEKDWSKVRGDIPAEHSKYMYKGAHPDDLKMMEETHSKQVRPFVARPISHYLFKNMNRKEATAYLSTKKQGDFVIRPSSHGPTHLTVTWKVVDVEPQVFFHIDIKEEDQPPNLGLIISWNPRRPCIGVVAVVVVE